MAINPETTEWVRALLRQEIDKAVAPLHQRIEAQDDWANGVFAALEDVLIPLLKAQPDIARTVAPLWRLASERFELLQRQDGQADDFHETAGLLEARKMLYRQLENFGVWPALPGG